jgi:dephospho-CoA kinase
VSTNEVDLNLRLIGLTGSIGMGKSTTAGMFRSAGVPVHDSDRVVRRLYSQEAVIPIGKMFPSVIQEGHIDRQMLASIILNDQSALGKVERVIHPMVGQDRYRFIDMCRRSGAKTAIIDIPLLFETGFESAVDVILTVTAPYVIQRERVIARPGMTDEKLSFLLSRQRPDAAKRASSHYMIDTSFGFDWVKAEVGYLLRTLSG